MLGYNALVRHLFHLLLNAAMILSVLLCVVTLVMWIRSYYASDHFGRWTRQIEGDRQTFVIEKSSGLFSRPGTVLIVNSMDRVVRDNYQNEKGRALTLVNESGRIAAVAADWPIDEIQASVQSRTGTDYLRIDFLGLRWGTVGWSSSSNALPLMRVNFLSIKYWVLIVLTLLWPMCRLLRVLRKHAGRKKLSGGLCLTCGYDLRASLNRCPECGTVPNDIKLIASPRQP